MIDWKLWLTIRRARKEVKDLVSRTHPVRKVVSYGATHVDPQHLVILVITDKDENRDQLLQDFWLHEQVRAVLHRVNYPTAAIPLVKLGFQSKETLDRDFEGSWYEATK